MQKCCIEGRGWGFNAEIVIKSMIFCLVSATSIAPKLSSSSPSDTSQTIVVQEDAANAVFKFADNSLRLTVDAGM